MLVAEGIAKSFGTHRVLQDVDLAVKPGGITALIGPSGSGKTTLLRALAMIDPPDRGAVRMDEQSWTFPWTSQTPLAPPYPDVTVVFQQLFLWPHMTLRQNILLATRNRGLANAQAGLDELAGLFAMGAFLDRYPNEVSIGQRQRAALARAMILKPRYLLLDEITSALDIEQIGNILSYLLAIRERGVGILLITHMLEFARNCADTIAFMEGGAILASGGRELIDAPALPRMQQFMANAALAR